jgi:hypothetical protein
MFLVTSNGLIGASNVKVILGVGNGFEILSLMIHHLPHVTWLTWNLLVMGMKNWLVELWMQIVVVYMMVFLVLSLLGLLGKFLLHILLVLQLVVVPADCLGLAFVHLDFLSDLLVQQPQCSQRY